jgi:hypothetical protein
MRISRILSLEDDMDVKDNEVVASELIVSNTREYAINIVENHFPNAIDGMKRVKRRILYTIKDPNETFSGMQLISSTIKIHNYGDSSIYDAGTRMADSFRNTFPLLELIGKGGSYSGDSAASSRYTKLRASEFYKDIFVNGINFKTIPMEQTEDLSGQEICYFIPKIPTALLYNNDSVGFGYNSKTVPLMFENICDIVVNYIKNKNDWNYASIANKFIPKFPIKIFIKNKDELISSYRKGVFDTQIETEGLYVIQSNNSVLFRTLAYGISPQSIRLNIIKAIKDKDHWLTKLDASFDTLSEDKNFIDFKITVKRGSNIFAIIDKLGGLLRYRSATHPMNNFVFKKSMLHLDPPEIVKFWYHERYRSILGTKKHRQQDLQLAKMKLETYLIICEHVDEVITIIKTNELETIYSVFRKRFELSMRQCEILLNTNLQTLMKSKRTELENRLIKVIEDIGNINESFNHIDDEICTELIKLKSKYRTDHTFTSCESNFIGCVIVGDLGIIQVNDASEVQYLSPMFSKQKLTFIPYYNGIESVKLNKYKICTKWQSLPYTSSSSSMCIKYKDKPILFVKSDKKTQLIDQKLGPYNISAEDYTTNHISRSGVVITKAGVIKELDQKYLDSSRNLKDILYAFDWSEGSSHVVVSVNDASLDTVRFQCIKSIKEKVRLSAAGMSTIVGVFPLTSTNDIEMILNLPKRFRYNGIIVNQSSKFTDNSKVLEVPIRRMEKI